MTLPERLTQLHSDAAGLYLRRQEVQGQIQRWQAQAAELDRALLRSDGAIELVQALIKAEQPSAHVIEHPSVPVASEG